MKMPTKKRRSNLFWLFLLTTLNTGKVHSTGIAADGNEFILNDLQLANLKATIETDDFKFFAEKMSLSARVVTAITLRNGLSDGSIPLDDVIEELLNIKSGSLKQLETFEKKKADDYLNQMLKVGNEVKDDSVAVEKEILAVFEMWIILENNDVSYDIPTKEEVSKLEVLKTWNYQALKTLNIDDVIKSIDAASTNADFKSSVNTFLNALTTVDNALGDSTPVMEVLKKINRLGIFSSLLGIYKNADLQLIKYKTSNDKDKLNVNFMKLDALKLEDAGMLNVVGAIPGSQLSSISKDKKYTSGFVEGYKDLGKLQSDIKDSWFTSSLKPSTSLEGVLSLRKLESGMKEVEEHWTSVSTAKNTEAMRKVSDLSLLSNSAKDATKNIDAAFDTLFKCFRDGSKDVIGLIQIIAEHGGDVFSMMTNLESMKKLTSSSAFTGLLSSNKKEDFQKLSSLFKLLKSSVEVFSVTIDVSKKVGEIKDNVNRAKESGNPDSLKKFEETFTCWKENGPSLTKVLDATRLVSQLRELKSDTTISKTIGDVTSAVSQSTASLKKVRKTAEEVKKENSKEVKSLEVFKDLKVASNPFGQSVAVLVTARDALGKSAALDSLANDGPVVDKLLESGAYSNSLKLNSDLRKTWPAFGELVQNIKSFLHEVGKQFAKIKDVKKAKFPSFGSFFVDLATLPKVDIQADKRLTVVKKLKTLATGNNDKKTLGDIEKSLEVVSSLDLDFTRFESSLKGMPSTMNQISLSFAKSSKNTTSAPGDEDEEETTTVAQEQGWVVFVSIGGGVFIFAVIVGVVAYCYLSKGSPYNKWRKNKKKENGQKDDKKKDKKQKKKGNEDYPALLDNSKNSKNSKPSKETSKTKKTETSTASNAPAAAPATAPANPAPQNYQASATRFENGSGSNASGAESDQSVGANLAAGANVNQKDLKKNAGALGVGLDGFVGEDGKTENEVSDKFGPDKKDRKTAGEDGFSVLKFLKSLFSRRRDDEEDDASGMAGAVA